MTTKVLSLPGKTMLEHYYLEWNLRRTDITTQEKQRMVQAWADNTARTIRETTDKTLKGKLIRQLVTVVGFSELYNLR